MLISIIKQCKVNNIINKGTNDMDFEKNIVYFFSFTLYKSIVFSQAG